MSRAQVSLASSMSTSVVKTIRAASAVVLLAVALVLSVGLAVGLAVGCKSADKAKDKPDSPQQGPDPGLENQPPASKPPASKPPAQKPTVEPIADSAVKTLMDRWLTAQNDGDFTTYEELYAKRLEGVRRSGEKVVRLDRAGWVKERKRMFKRKMVVEVSDLEIDVFTQSAIATFIQRWASGKYEDIGPKQLVIVRDDGQLRIAREEMLQSTLVGDAKKTALADKRFVFVIKAGNGEYAVFDRLRDVPTSEPRLLSKGDPVVVAAKVNGKKLPAAVAEWQGASLQNGACQGKVGDILALSRIVPHFGERQTWDGTFDDSPAMKDDEIARAAFHEDGAYLVGKLATEGCSMGAYASVVGQPAPAVGAPVAGDMNALEKAARKAFRGLESYKDLAEEFSALGQTGDWESYDPDGGKPGEIRVTAMRHAGNQKVFVVAQAHAGHGCGDFEGSLTAFFEMSGSLKKPRLKKVHEMGTHPRVVAALDIAANGTLAFLVEDFSATSVISWKGHAVRSVIVPFFDCGC